MDGHLSPSLPSAVGAVATLVVLQIARAVVVLVVVAGAAFVLTDLLPGDAAGRTVGREADVATLEAARAELGLDRPLPERLGRWLARLAHGDLGTTARGRPVTDVLDDAFARTLVLAGVTFVLVAVGSLVLGTITAWRAGGTVDRITAGMVAVTVGVPEFVVVTFVVLVLARWLGLVPGVVVPDAGGGVAPSMLVVPVISLVIPLLAWTTRLVRGAVRDTLAMPHIEMAILDGLSPARILLRHALPFAAPGVAAALATATVGLFGGAVVVETSVNYPGLGSVLAAGVDARDVPLVTGATVVVCAVMVAALAVADAVRRFGPAPRHG